MVALWFDNNQDDEADDDEEQKKDNLAFGGPFMIASGLVND